MTQNVAALVACGKNKRNSRQPCWKLYTSTLFEKSWAAACMTGDPYVMSAEHHLLHPDERIEPYNETLKDYSWEEQVSWAETVLAELPAQYDTIALFGGRDYVEPIMHVTELETIDMYADCTGNGQQMGVAGDIVREVVENNE